MDRIAKSYDVGSGTKGYLPVSDEYMEFSTYDEYIEYFKDELDEMNNET